MRGALIMPRVASFLRSTLRFLSPAFRVRRLLGLLFVPTWQRKYRKFRR